MEQPLTTSDQPPKVGSLINFGLALVLIGLIGLTAYRVQRNYSAPSTSFDWSTRGHSDFHNGAYFPALAFRKGINPYAAGIVEKYPVAAPMRPCPPVTFLLHMPFTLFDLPAADVLFFAFNTSLLLFIGFLAIRFASGKPPELRTWLLVSCGLLISRPVHISLFTGYYTFELVLGTILALQYARSKPVLSGLGMLLASSKPTFVLPLIVLMLARKNFRAAVIGITLCTTVGIGGLAWLGKETGISTVVKGITEGQEEFHSDETEFPINTWTRVDVLGMFAKTINWIPDDKAYLAGMLVLLIVPAFAIHRVTNQESDDGAAGLTASIVVLTILLAIYHHSYDCTLVVVPLVGFMFFRNAVLPEIGTKSKWVMGILLAVPFLNYLSTQTARDRLGFEQLDTGWQIITQINGCCLLICLSILLHAAFTYRQTLEPTTEKK